MKVTFILPAIGKKKGEPYIRTWQQMEPLTISTLQALFEGRRELFTGLAAEQKWDWDKKYPVIKLSFAGVARNVADMKQDIENIQKLDLSESMPVEDVLRRLRALTTNDWGEAAYFKVNDSRYCIRIEIKKEDV